MSPKGRKVSSSPVAEAAERRRQWLAKRLTSFIPGVLQGYRTLGRGVLVIHEVDITPNPHQTPGVYVPEMAARVSERIPLDEKTLQWMNAYNPDHEFVAIIIGETGAATSFRMQFRRNTAISA